jgi:hypothetical protein
MEKGRERERENGGIDMCMREGEREDQKEREIDIVLDTER